MLVCYLSFFCICINNLCWLFQLHFYFKYSFFFWSLVVVVQYFICSKSYRHRVAEKSLWSRWRTFPLSLWKYSCPVCGWAMNLNLIVLSLIYSQDCNPKTIQGSSYIISMYYVLVHYRWAMFFNNVAWNLGNYIVRIDCSSHKSVLESHRAASRHKHILWYHEIMRCDLFRVVQILLIL